LRRDVDVCVGLFHTFAVDASILAVLDFLTHVTARIYPVELVISADQFDFRYAVNDLSALPAGSTFEAFTASAADATTAVVTTFNSRTGGEALALRTSAVFAVPSRLAFAAIPATAISTTVLLIALRQT